MQLTHPKLAHTAVNRHTVSTHLEQWAGIYAVAPREELGVCCLAQGQLSRGIEGGRERCTLTPPTYNSIQVQISNIRPRLPPIKFRMVSVQHFINEAPGL